MPKIDPSQLDPRNNLQWYSSSAVRNADVWTDRLVRQEYRRLRDIAQKRLKRLAISEPASYAYRTNAGKFGTTKSMTTQQLRQMLPDLAKFVAAKTSSVSGIRKQREKAVASLRQNPLYSFVTEENLAKFGDFMDELRASKEAKMYGYERALNTIRVAMKQNDAAAAAEIKDVFAQWLLSQKKLSTYVRKQTAKGKEVSSDDILAEFDRLETQRRKRNEAARRRNAEKKRKK